MTTETLVILAGFGHAVSKTHLSCAAQGSHVNILARTLVQIEADWRRTLATRDKSRVGRVDRRTRKILTEIARTVRLKFPNLEPQAVQVITRSSRIRYVERKNS